MIKIKGFEYKFFFFFFLFGLRYYLMLKRPAYDYQFLMAVREPGYHFPFSIF